MCDAETVLANACQSGIGKLESRIKLLQVIAQLLCSKESDPCGTPSNTIRVSGAGSQELNGDYVFGGGVYSMPNTLNVIAEIEGNWVIADDTLDYYTTSSEVFPCGEWTPVNGSPPAPTTQYA